MRPRLHNVFLIGVCLLTLAASHVIAVELSDIDQIVEDNVTVVRLKQGDGLLDNRIVEKLTPKETAVLQKYRATNPPGPVPSRKRTRNQLRPLLVNKDGIRIRAGIEDAHEAILDATVIGYEKATALSTVVLGISGGQFWVSQFKDESGATDSFWPTVLEKLEKQNPGNAVRQDPFLSCIEYLKKHNKEVFWSIRVNDTHDYNVPLGDLTGWKGRMARTSDRDGNPFLVGTTVRPPRYTRSNALNFSNRDVRTKFLQTVKAGGMKLARQYRLDGIELDFTRHPVLFKSVADGGTASRYQLNLITEMVRAIRQHLDQTGLRRGRPVLLMVRIPDSVVFCRSIGIDIERWLDEGLVDLAVNSDYYVLTPWRKFADFCHRYNVRYYACLERRRIEQDVPGISLSARMSVPIRPELWRGEALAAWNNRVDGIYIFNRPAATADALHLDLHSPDELMKLNFPEIIIQTEMKPHSAWTHPARWARKWN